MAEGNGRQTPPYIPYSTFDNFLNGLAEGVPDKIDSSLMRNLSGSTRSGLMVTLRFLNLVDEEDNTFAALDKLAKAKDASRGPILRELMQKSYSFLRQPKDDATEFKYLDLSRATPAQLSEAIGEEGATGGTRDKAVNFFLKAAEVAGIPISPHILKRKHVRASPTAKRQKRPSHKTKKTGAQEPDFGSIAPRSAYEILMNDIYDPAEMKEGSAEEKAVFVLARYLKRKETEK